MAIHPSIHPSLVSWANLEFRFARLIDTHVVRYLHQLGGKKPSHTERAERRAIRSDREQGRQRKTHPELLPVARLPDGAEIGDA